jgi:hypothetical protein
MTLLAQSPQEAANANQLADLAKHARDAGDAPKEAESLCRAAVLDPKKYQKRCDRAKNDLVKTLAQFDADFSEAQFELRHRDFPGAVRDLSKITFGPHRDEAQVLMQQVRVVGRLGSPEQVSQLALQLANAAYAKGNLDATEAWLNYINVPSLQSIVSQLQTNIRIYRDAMRQASLLALNHDLKGAAQKYQFAATIVPNGPGNPKDQLRQMLAQQAAADQALAQQHSAPQNDAASPQKVNNPAKMRSLLNSGRRAEASGDWGGAARAYAAVLALDPDQKDALAARKRVLAKLDSDSKALEGVLKQGITQFYASQFAQASDSIGMYLQKGGKSHAGAAQFYLGATLTALQIVGDPKDTAHAESLRQQAQEHFAAARQLHYAPLHGAVPPKILEQWTQTGDAQ